MRKYSLYKGLFVCYDCKGSVSTARYWTSISELTWKCNCGYISKVNLNIKGY